MATIAHEMVCQKAFLQEFGIATQMPTPMHYDSQVAILISRINPHEMVCKFLEDTMKKEENS